MLPIESIVYLLRKTSLTIKDIGKLSPFQVNELLKEFYFQESVEEYRRQEAIAEILAAIYNTIPRKKGSKTLTAKDFLSGDMPTRDGEKKVTDIDILARAKGIILPSK